MEKPVIIFGAGTLGRMVLGILKSHDFDIYGFLDDTVEIQEIDNIPVLGKTDDEELLKLIGHKTRAIVAIEELMDRKKLTEFLIEVRKVMPMNAIHTSVLLPENSSIGHGNIFGAGVIIEPGVDIGNHSLISGLSFIGSNTKIGDFCNIGAACVLNSESEIEDEVFVGSGSVLVTGIKAGQGSRIGAGSVVVQHVVKGKTVFGNPAKEV
jgi:sugar O-acyltransferase (sialic acid O-acetyltransferase NeuD family)